MENVTAMVHTRVLPETKLMATRILADMGLTLSDGIRVFLTKLVQQGAMPFDLSVPNAKTLAAMKEVESLMEEKKARFASPEELFEAIEKDARH